MFTNTYLPHVGGVARSVQTFTEDLRRMGHRVLVVAPEYSRPDGSTEPEEDILRAPAIQNFNGSDFSVRFPQPFAVSQAIKDFAPDIIHSHHPFLMGDTALRAARSHGLPLVFTHHTLYEEYTHYVPMDSEAMKRFVIRLSTDYANFCTRVVAPSRSVVRLIRKRGVERPIEEIPTGVDLDFFSKGRGRPFRKAHGIPTDAWVIGHLGRLAFEKNLDYLAEAVSLFMQDRPQSVFLVVGSGPAAAQIQTTFKRKGLADRLILAGKQTGQDLSDAYHAMNAFAFSSKSETQGMVLVEAMASGVPVVALDASGAREVVEDDRNGRLLPQDVSPEMFAEAVGDVVGRSDTIERYRRNALQTARNLSRHACAERLLRVYRGAIDEEAPRHAPQTDEFIPWETLLERLKAEWDLIAQKTTAAASAVGSEESNGDLE
jgi:glycosyltransferase involved in cell wall biosynthesis